MDNAQPFAGRTVKLYLSPAMWADLAVSAASNRRSLPSEIAFRLARDAAAQPAPEAMERGAA